MQIVIFVQQVVQTAELREHHLEFHRQVPLERRVLALLLAELLALLASTEVAVRAAAVVEVEALPVVLVARAVSYRGPPLP